jgi:hypothetical protein
MTQIGLSAAQLLEVVDAADGRDPAERGLRLLAAAAPELPEERLEEIGLGDRDARILLLRCATFGDTLPARVLCPACGLRLSVRIPRGEVMRQPSGDDLGAPAPLRVEEGALVVEARAPDGRVLATAAGCPDVESARRALIVGCVSGAWHDGEPVDPLALDDALLERVGEAIVAADPQVEVAVEMRCAGCAAEWSPILDIADYFWREISAAGVQLLDEVHQLAAGYGWSEEQVLRLPSRRRRQYVERLVGE